MADPTKVLRFPNRKKLHLVWSSSSVEDFAEQAQKPGNTHLERAEAIEAPPRNPGNGTVVPKKPD